MDEIYAYENDVASLRCHHVEAATRILQVHTAQCVSLHICLMAHLLAICQHLIPVSPMPHTSAWTAPKQVPITYNHLHIAAQTIPHYRATYHSPEARVTYDYTMHTLTHASRNGAPSSVTLPDILHAT